MAQDYPSIDEIVGLLADYSPDTLETLRKSFPTYQDLLAVGMMAGEVDEAMHVRLSTAKVLLEKLADACNKALEQTRRKIRLAHHIQIVGDIVAAISTASIISLVAKDAPKPATYLAAMLSLIGLLCPKLVKFVYPVNTDTKEVFELYKKLIKCQNDAEQLVPEVNACLQSDKNRDTCNKTIKSVNLLAAEIRDTLGKLV